MNTTTPNNSLRAKFDPPGTIWLREAQASVRYEEDARVMAAEFSRNFKRVLNCLSTEVFSYLYLRRFP